MTTQNSFVSLKVAAESKLAGVSKETAFKIKPSEIKIRPGFNRPIDRSNVEQFKESIRAGATIPPIYVDVDAGDIFMVDGEHRLIAVKELIEDGVEILNMSAIQFRGNDADRIAHLLTSAQGKPLSPLEAGLQYLKLIRLGWDNKQISARIGRSTTHVDECLTLAESNGDVHAAIRAGEVSGSTAAKIIKKHGSKAGAVIAEKLVTAKAIGKKKVTAAVERKTISDKQLMDWLDGYVGDLSEWVKMHVRSESGLSLREAVTIASTLS